MLRGRAERSDGGRSCGTGRRLFRAALGLVLLAASLALGAAPASAELRVRYWCTEGTGPAGDCGGWHTTTVTLHWEVTDATDAPSCPPAVALSREGENRWTCRASQEQAGGTTTITTTAIVRIDQTPPRVSGADTSPAAGPEGWLRQPTQIAFRGTDRTSGIADCTTTTYAGPDTGAGSVVGTCRDQAGLVSAPFAYAVRYDATPPEITAAVAQRPPDHRGWYTHPVAFAVQGADALSGLASCGPPAYDGPAGDPATFLAVCSDQAGNSAVRPFPLRYDAAPPLLSPLVATPGDRMVRLRWVAPPDVARIVVRRTPGRRGRRPVVVYTGTGGGFTDLAVRNGRTYRYTVVSIDRAGNAATRRLGARPGVRLLAPRPFARLTAPPVLTWTPVRGARYYNVQLFRNGRRVLSAWPTAAHLGLTALWTDGRHTYRLVPGRYRWYVWPGFGPRAQRRFGALVGRRTFIVPRAATTRR